MATKRAETGTYLGHCTGCKKPVLTTEKFVKHSCGEWIVAYRPVKARITDHVCGPRCTSALGPNCDCSCGGENHGADHR